MTEDSNALADELDARLANADTALAAAYPGDRGRRQPVHTVYVPADRYDSETVGDWAEEARQALAAHGGSTTELAQALDLQPNIAAEIYERISRKLDAEAIEDLRIDFEDGYGIRPDEDESQAALRLLGRLRRLRRGLHFLAQLPGIRRHAFRLRSGLRLQSLRRHHVAVLEFRAGESSLSAIVRPGLS